jgi:large exoprotein involved in heme utilization and adhesion
MDMQTLMASLTGISRRNSYYFNPISNTLVVELIGIFTSLLTRGNIGKGGNLTIETERLTVSGGAQISASTLQD